MHRKKPSIHFLVTHYLQIVHLIKQKTNLIVTESKTVWKDFVTKIINYEEKEMIPLADKEKKSYEEQNVCHICKKEFIIEK